MNCTDADNNPLFGVNTIPALRAAQDAGNVSEWSGARIAVGDTALDIATKLGLTPISQRLQVSAHCDAFRRAGSCPRRT